jgi:hypothetical protein
MKRYSIMARPYGHNREVEVCQCDSNPVELVDAALEMKLRHTGNNGITFLINKYEHVYFVDHEAGSG